jgi:hypothetical protein
MLLEILRVRKDTQNVDGLRDQMVGIRAQDTVGRFAAATFS